MIESYFKREIERQSMQKLPQSSPHRLHFHPTLAIWNNFRACIAAFPRGRLGQKITETETETATSLI